MPLRLACSSGAALVAVLVGSCLPASAASAHPLKPAGVVIAVDTFYGNMLEENGNFPRPEENVTISARQLVRSGPCVYDSSGITTSPAERVDDTPAGEGDTYCPPTLGGHTTHRFTPRAKLINNPSMDFQPLLNKLGTQAAESVGLASTSHGTPTDITISLNPKQQTGEADVFYARSQPATSTRQLKELRFVTHGHTETVRDVWY